MQLRGGESQNNYDTVIYIYKLYITLYIYNLLMLYVHANLPIVNSPVIKTIRVKMGCGLWTFFLVKIILK